jgi:serine/threonine-protein kinase
MKLALETRDQRRADISVPDLQRKTMTRLTFGAEVNMSPAWTPDGKRIAYTTVEEGGVTTLDWIRADGSGEAQRLSESTSLDFADMPSWRPDGKVLAFERSRPGSPTGSDIYTMTMKGNERTGRTPGEPKSFLVSPADEVYPEFSPDGRWIAYISNESGTREIYVRPFPAPVGKWQISSGGGHHARWAGNGKELYYDRDDQIMVVPYTASGDSFVAGQPAVWSQSRIVALGRTNLAMQADGKRAIVFERPGGEAQAQANKIVPVFNFFDELRSTLPK